MPTYNTPDPQRAGFARTNRQTIAQRAALMRELLPETRGIAELCCGDCTAQWELYRAALPGLTFCGLDIAPAIIAANRAAGVPCLLGDALDPAVLRPFLAYDVIFFGPPLSAGCDGHHALAFDAVEPGFAAFADLFLGRLGYAGTLVCIGPKTTHMGDIRRLYDRVRAQRADFSLRLIHHSHATVTGGGSPYELRLKYLELWFSGRLPDAWEVRRQQFQMWRSILSGAAVFLAAESKDAALCIRSGLLRLHSGRTAGRNAAQDACAGSYIWNSWFGGRMLDRRGYLG